MVNNFIYDRMVMAEKLPADANGSENRCLHGTFVALEEFWIWDHTAKVRM